MKVLELNLPEPTVTTAGSSRTTKSVAGRVGHSQPRWETGATRRAIQERIRLCARQERRTL